MATKRPTTPDSDPRPGSAPGPAAGGALAPDPPDAGRLAAETAPGDDFEGLGLADLEPDPDYNATHGAVIQCPNCQSSFPITPDLDMFEPETHPDFLTCQDCNGLGKILTGSRIAEHSVAVCPGCKGKGWNGPTAIEPFVASLSTGDQPPMQGAVKRPDGHWYYGETIVG